MVAAAVGVAGIAAGAYSSSRSRSSSRDASRAQERSAEAGIEEQRRQFDQVRELLTPYANAGTSALGQQQDLLGTNGADAQGAAIAALQKSPQFTSLLEQGNNNILQNASATGGLRGGNTQAALAQFSPQLLNQIIDQQYGRLGGMVSLGQNAAAGVGNAGMQTGSAVSSLLQQQGAAQAGNALAQGRAQAGIANSISSGIGAYAGMGGFGSFGGSTGGSFKAYDTGGYGMNSGGAGRGGDFSDVRLKTNIRRIGKTDRGNVLYEWDWRATGKKGRGVIAQEVTHVPGAVAEDPCTGFLTVNYDRV
jgi:hypothetical protein